MHEPIYLPMQSSKPRVQQPQLAHPPDSSIANLAALRAAAPSRFLTFSGSIALGAGHLAVGLAEKSQPGEQGLQSCGAQQRTRKPLGGPACCSRSAAGGWGWQPGCQAPAGPWRRPPSPTGPQSRPAPGCAVRLPTPGRAASRGSGSLYNVYPSWCRLVAGHGCRGKSAGSALQVAC